MENLIIYFENTEYYGLKLKHTNSYPWNSKKEKNNFYDHLIEKNDQDSKITYKKWCKKEILERKHINLSRSIISEFISYLIFFIAIILFVNHFNVYLLFCLSLFTLLSKFYFERQAKRENIEMCNILIDFMFEMK